MNISIFGASVTQQRNGFAAMLPKYLKANYQIFGYGGTHLDDSAMCFISDVIESQPDICLIDWFSTGYNTIGGVTEELLDTLLFRFSQARIILLFLFLPYRDSPGKADFYDFCKSYLSHRQIGFLDISAETDESDINLILRDSIHTTPFGSRRYAQIIAEWIVRNQNTFRVFPVSAQNKTRFSEIKVVSINQEYSSELQVIGNLEHIWIQIIVGPHSGILNIKQGEETNTLNTWDRWCVYPRMHMLNIGRITDKMMVSISDQNFDTSSCKYPINFNKIKKRLLINRVFYIGETTPIILSRSKKRPVNSLRIHFQAIYGRFLQLIFRFMGTVR